VQQVDSVTNKDGSNNTLPNAPGENGVNGCSRSVCNDVTSVITNQQIHAAKEMEMLHLSYTRKVQSFVN
jgi:hypothetical protein